MTRDEKIKMLTMKLDGYSYADIAKYLGVTKQDVEQKIKICLGMKGLKKPRTIYKGLNTYMGENDLIAEDIAKVIGKTVQSTRFKLQGQSKFTLPEIETILAYTGLSYGECFGQKETWE